jgi:hypothetical protein
MKRFLVHLLFALAAAFALTSAAPTFAGGCDHCKNCPKQTKSGAASKGKKAAKPADKASPAAPAAAAEPEKKAEGTTKCDCGKDGKGCICKKGECKCANCGAPKLSAADEKPKCECGKGKAECACKKGECKCKHGTKAAA